MKPKSAGYSRRPLAEKLGIRRGGRIALLDPPEGYASALGLGEETTVHYRLSQGLDLVQAFSNDARSLKALFPRLVTAVKPEGAIWVSWPKKGSGVETDLSDHAVRKVGLENGLVDVKVCAVDETWSALKFTRRARGSKTR